MKLSESSIRRLCGILSLMDEMEEKGIKAISSAQMGLRLGAKADTIRKDISCLGEIGPSPRGYPADKLRVLIEDRLYLTGEQNTCVVGLGDMGFSLLKNKQFSAKRYRIVAGFDSSINRIELLQTEIPLYPLHEIAEVVRAERIRMAILTTAKDHTQEAAQRLIDGGIRGILNLTSEILISATAPVQIRNMGFIEELRVLAANLGIAEKGESHAEKP